LTLSCEALGDPISTHTFGTPTQRPVFPILKYTAFIGTRFLEAKRVSFYKFILTPRAHTHWAAGAFRDEFQLMLSTQQRWARLGAASDFPTGTRAHTAQGGGPLCPMRIDFLFMMARSGSPQHTLRAALVGSYLKHFSLLKGTLRVSANSRFADNDVAMATAVLA